MKCFPDPGWPCVMAVVKVQDAERDHYLASAGGRRWMSRYEPGASLLLSAGPSSAAVSAVGSMETLDGESEGTPPGSSVAAAYLTAQSCHRGCCCCWLRMRIRGGPVTDERRLGLRSRAHIGPGLHHSIPCAGRETWTEMPCTFMSQSHRPFPEPAFSLCSTGSREAEQQCGLDLVGQRRGSRPFLGRCVVEEAPAWLEVKAPLASYWPTSLHLLSQIRPISATITFKTGIRPPAPALPFASAIPLLPPAFHPRAWRPHLSILTSISTRRRTTRDPLCTFGDRSFLSGRLEAQDVSFMCTHWSCNYHHTSARG